MEAELSAAAEKVKCGDKGDDTGNGGEVSALGELGKRGGAKQHQERARRLCTDPHRRMHRACSLRHGLRRGGATMWPGIEVGAPPPPTTPRFSLRSSPLRPAAAAIA